MFNKKSILKNVCVTSIAVIMALSSTVPAYARTYNDIDNIMRGIKFNVPQKLIVASPSKDITTTASKYYISGSSNPKYNLTCNGYDVSAVGSQGSFATYVDLDYGVNTFTFKQSDGSQKTIKITRERDASVTPSNRITNMTPSYTSAYVSGEKITLKCVSPYGSTVTATIMGKSYTLSPVTSAQNGTPTTHKLELTVPDVSVIKDVGKVKYTMTYKGETKNYSSSGNILIYPQGSTVYVEVLQSTVPLLVKPDDIYDVICPLRRGGIDYVIDQTNDRYKLACGGWINKDGVEPIQNVRTTNNITDINFFKTMNGEMLTFTGSSRPVVVSTQSNTEIQLKMYHSKGFNSLPQNINTSRVIKSYTIEPKNDYTLVTLNLKDSVLGHVVDYNDDTISVYIKYKPQLSNDVNKPLKNITISIDPGHGGLDLGATGVTHTSGDSECHITANTAIALRRRLEGLGATVNMVNIDQNPQHKTPYIRRMEPAFLNQADMFISLHCNSAGGDARKPKGVEIYYYYSRHESAAENILNGVVSQTGRTKRKALQSVYRVTFNSLAPSMLLEMGFISNPKEYDELNSREGIFNTVNGIADGIINYFTANRAS